MKENGVSCSMVNDDSEVVYSTKNYDASYDSHTSTSSAPCNIRNRFNLLFNQWWDETCVFSGRNFFISNPNFKKMLEMGRAILPLVQDKMQNEPPYKQRALKWLHDAVVAL